VVQRVRGIMKKDGGAFERMEVAGLIQETVRLVEKEAFIRNVGIRMESDPSLPQVVVDRIQIQQVLINLLFNAMEAMADGGPDRGITVRSAMNDKGRVVVAVEDTGKGIAPEEAAQLFEPFYTTKQGGLGLGLSISRSIVEAHGGKLLVRPNPRGGAVFSFTLQAAQGSAR